MHRESAPTAHTEIASAPQVLSKEVCSRKPGGLRFDLNVPVRRTRASETKPSQAKPNRAAEAKPSQAKPNRACAAHNRGSAARVVDEGREASGGSEAEHEAECWAALHTAIDRLARPVLEASGLLLGTSRADFDDDAASAAAAEDARCVIDRAGCVESFPCAPQQEPHRDGPERGLVNAFVPLVHVKRASGPTEFWPGSHLDEDFACWQVRLLLTPFDSF